jgi:hypothetical protein
VTLGAPRERRNKPEGVTRRFGIAVGQTYASRRNRHRDRVVRTMRGSPRITARESERAWFVRKGRWSRPPSLRGNESSGFIARTSQQLQKSASSISASNKHVRSAPKRVAVRVNGGLGRRESRFIDAQALLWIETASVEAMSGGRPSSKA